MYEACFGLIGEGLRHLREESPSEVYLFVCAFDDDFGFSLDRDMETP